jgi:thiazole/oxazole-forming peptide maturase SagD family component
VSDTAALTEEYALDVRVSDDGLIPSGRYRAAANGRNLVGTASAPTPQMAGERAVFEWLERFAQFGPRQMARLPVGRRADVAGALDPRVFGLYTSQQYASPGFPCRPYSDDERYAWVRLTRLGGRSTAFVPAEFIFPNFHRDDPSLVRETSSGTAASFSAEQAIELAVCEALERDALMRWWYRHTPAGIVDCWHMPWRDVVDDIDALAEGGLVVVIGRLPTIAGVPCFAACARRGSRTWIGSACASTESEAIRHAVRELAETVCSFAEWGVPREMQLRSVRRVSDHHALYQDERGASIIDGFLAKTLRPVDVRGRPGPACPTVLPRGGVAQLMADRGLSAYACMLRIPGPTRGPWVARVLVEGIVPFHAGFGMERLGCTRLVERSADGCIRTLLPHCFA